MNGIPPKRRMIRLFPEYGLEWPLWENSTPTWDVGYATTPDLYGLSEGLTRAMADWNLLWSSNFDHEDGWKNESAREQWREEGLIILERLRAEVADFADVKYEPWPLGDSAE